MEFPYTPPSGDLWKVTCLFFALLALFIIPLRWFNPSKKIWKCIEYIWLFIASFSLVSATFSVRNLVLDTAIPIQEKYVATLYNIMYSRVTTEAQYGSSICRDFSSTSPDIIQIQKQYDNLCSWYKEAEKLLASSNSLGTSNVELPKIKFNLSDKILIDRLETLKLDFSDYDDNKKLYVDMQKRHTPNIFESTIISLFPYLLAFALAIRFAKATGELIHERAAERKEESKNDKKAD